MFEDKLKEIGFSKNEAKVYLELLRIGPQAVSVVASRLSINRTSAYSVLQSLLRKGVVGSFRNNNIRVFVANDPNSLIGYLDRKCRTYDYYRSQILSVIPKFRCLKKDYAVKKPVVRYFEGIEGVKHVMYDALDAQDVLRSYLSLYKWLGCGLRDFLIKYRDIRINRSVFFLKAIAHNTREVKGFFEENYNRENSLTDILYINKNVWKKC